MMPNVDWGKVVEDMFAAAARVLKNDWPRARTYAEPELKHLAETAAYIEAKKLSGQITEDSARALLVMYKDTLANVALTMKGLGMLSAEAAANAALAVLRVAVQTATGWALL